MQRDMAVDMDAAVHAKADVDTDAAVDANAHADVAWLKQHATVA